MAMSVLKQTLYIQELAKVGFTNTEYLADVGKIRIEAGNLRMPLITDAGDISYGTEYTHLVKNTIGPLVKRVNKMAANQEGGAVNE